MIKAIVIDDEPLARLVVLEYLEHYPQIEVVAECNDGFEGVKAIAAHEPELVFLECFVQKSCMDLCNVKMRLLMSEDMIVAHAAP